MPASPLPPFKKSSVFDGFFERLHLAAYIADAETGVPIYIQPSIRSIIGEEAEAVFEKEDYWEHYVHPDDFVMIREHMAGLAAGNSYDLSYRIVRKDGSAIRVRDIGIFEAASESEPARLQGVLWEISDEILPYFGRGASLPMDEAFLRAVPDLWVVFDEEGTVLDCKPGLEFPTLIPREEMLGLGISEILPPGLGADFEAMVNQALTDGSTLRYEYQLPAASGEPEWREARFTRFGADRVLCVVTRTSQRKQAERNLASRAAILSAVSRCASLFLSEPSRVPLKKIVGLIGEGSGVDRCYIFQNFEYPTGLLHYRQVAEWCAEGVPSQWDNENLYDLAYEEVGFGPLARRMAQGELMALDPEQFEEPARSIITGQGIRSLFLAPIFVREKWWGFFGFDDCRRVRAWSDEERDVLQTAASLIGLALAQQANQEELAESQEMLAEREETFRILFDNSPQPIILTQGAEARVVEVNPAGRDMLAAKPGGLAQLALNVLLANGGSQADSTSLPGNVMWFRTKEGPAAPFKVTRRALSLRSGLMDAWFLQSYGEIAERERDVFVRQQLIGTLTRSTDAFATASGVEEGLEPLLRTLVESPMIQFAAFCVTGMDPFRSLVAVDRREEGEGIETVVRNERLPDCFCSSPESLRLMAAGRLIVRGLEAESGCCGLPVRENSRVLVCPVFRHGQVHAVLSLSWRMEYGEPGLVEPVLRSVASSIGRRLELERTSKLNARMRDLAAVLSSANDLIDLAQRTAESVAANPGLGGCVVYGYAEESALLVRLGAAGDGIELEKSQAMFPGGIGLPGSDLNLSFVKAQLEAEAESGVHLQLVTNPDGYHLLVAALGSMPETSREWMRLLLESHAGVITASYRAMQARLDSQTMESRLNLLMTGTGLLFVTLNRFGEVTSLNPYAENLFARVGLKGRPGQRIRELLDEADLLLFENALEEARVASRAAISVDLRGPEGDTLPIEGYLVRVLSPGMQYFELIGTDVTEQRESRRTLLLLRQAFEGTTAPAVITEFRDGNPLVLAVNGAFGDLLKPSLKVSEVVGVPLVSLLPQIEVDVRYALAGASDQRFEFRHGQTHRWYQVTVSEIQDEAGMGEYHVWNFIDVTESKQASFELTKALVQEQQLHQLKSRLISTTSHEFRTPLSVILSSTELLRRYSHRWEAEKIDQHLGKIDQSTRRMAEMIEGVLEYERQSPERARPQIEPLDVEEQVALVVGDLAAADADWHGLRIEKMGELGRIFGDRHCFHQILSNLLTNARKYSGGLETVVLRLESEGDSLRMTVSDGGIGIPEDELPTIMDPFVRATNTVGITGTGVGLSIVKRCVESLSGDVTIRSKVGEGTEVEVVLPRRASK